jgi:hypothetical protein
MLAVILSLLLPKAALCVQPRVIDDFETLSGWRAVTSHGDASKMTLSSVPGKDGKALLMEYSFAGYMGSAAAEKKLGLRLPGNYRFSFDVRGETPVNNFVIRVMDSKDDVWLVSRTKYAFPKDWTKFTFQKSQMPYGWGPSGGGELEVLDRIMLMVDVVEGGSGKIWIDNFTIEPLDEGPGAPPSVRATSSRGAPPAIGADGATMGAWRSGGLRAEEELTFSADAPVNRGGLVIDWEEGLHAREFEVLSSSDGSLWTSVYHATACVGNRSYVYLKDFEARDLKLRLLGASAGGFGIKGLKLKGPEFSSSVLDLFSELAADRPKGYFPKYVYKRQSFWTIVGAHLDTSEALVNEQGMVETDKLDFSLEPFLFTDGSLVTWNDAETVPSLEEGCLPIPSVLWRTRRGLELEVKALAEGSSGESVLALKYGLRNASARRASGKLFLAAVPFQVNPPWQTFTIIGGPSRIERVRNGAPIRINGKSLFPVSKPSGFGAATFDQGHVTEFLRKGELPPEKDIDDPLKLGSAALGYDFDLAPGESKEVVVAVPFHDRHGPIPAGASDADAKAYFDKALRETASFWREKVNRTSILLGPAAGPVADTIKTNLAYILINADDPQTQPGSRNYERSWIRDGSLTCAALLQMGIHEEVRRYLDWYAGYQEPDGSVPAVVEAWRGPERVPEHDSHGEFIFALRQYYEFTRDKDWLRGKWPNVLKAVDYLRFLRAKRKVEPYLSGTPEQRALYGLLPESISHEGYCPVPMHSYWDDFFGLRGLKDAIRIAEVLGEKEAAAAFARERDDFRKDILASLRLAMKNKGISFLPGCAESGDLDPLSTSIALSPCDETESLPRKELIDTFERAYKNFLQRKENAVRWDGYLPYEARIVSAYTLLGRKDRALELLEYLMRDRRPAAWNEWAEVVYKDYDAGKGIGDMPHSWAASDFIRAVRGMLVQERDKDGALVVAAGIPDPWVSDPAGVAVKNLPTYYGPLTFSIKKSGGSVRAEVSGPVTIPKGGIVVRSPLSREPKAVRVDGKAVKAAREASLSRLPAVVEFSY